MPFRILHLTYILLLFSTAYEKIRGLTIITAREPSTKDNRISISLSSKNDSADLQYTATKIRENAEHIVCNINFERIERLLSIWSQNSSATDYSTGEFLLDSTKYANSLEDFVKQYPTVTVVTEGKAESFRTFGDVGKNKFGTKIYSTSFFTDKVVHYEVLVKAHKEEFDKYEVGVNIGLGFKSSGTLLYLAPYIDGYIISTKVCARILDFGLRVSLVTFNPNNILNSLLKKRMKSETSIDCD